MFNMSENYRLRKCFLERNQVPTQTLMRQKMSPDLADIYFKSMSPKLKVLAGLEPPLCGGGTSWYIPPKDLLQGQVVMRPLKKEYMSKLNCYGVDDIGMKLIQDYRNHMRNDCDQIIYNYNLEWERKVEERCQQHKADCSATAAKAHTAYIRAAVGEFSALYSVSINKLEDLFFSAAVAAIKNTRKEIFQKMQNKYEHLLQQQATELYNKYTTKLTLTKEELKSQFVKRLVQHQNAVERKLHDINVEKHVTIEKFRIFFECLTLATQVYVALIERQECSKQMDFDKKKHSKSIKLIERELAYKDVKIRYAQNKEIECHELETLWKKKLGHVFSKFQAFVSYCLNMLPEHAEFFINLEKLFLMQISEALLNPSASSVILMEMEPFISPKPKPHPYYVFCDKRDKAKVNQDLCPKHCTSSASQLPVVVINKRCIYSACDNIEQLADKVKDYIDGIWGEDDDVEDIHDYSRDIPVTCTSLQRLLELNLESSLFQLLQQEIANARDLSIECKRCKMPHCFCFSVCSSSSEQSVPAKSLKQPSLPPQHISQDSLHLHTRLTHEREPKLENYAKYIKPKKCDCTKRARKDLFENLPIYMRKMSKYEAPEMLNYDMCTLAQIKNLVNKKSGSVTPVTIVKTESKQEVGVQTSDIEFDYICTCFSDDSVNRFYNTLNKPSGMMPQKSMFRSVHVERDVFNTPHVVNPTKVVKTVKEAYFIDQPTSRPTLNEKCSGCDCPY